MSPKVRAGEWLGCFNRAGTDGLAELYAADATCAAGISPRPDSQL
jgi:hypothetical protein